MLTPLILFGLLASTLASNNDDSEMMRSLSEKGVDVTQLSRGMNSSGKNCASACNTLFTFYGQEAGFPNSVLYENTTSSYFAEEQAVLKPACVFRPVNATEVAVAVLVSRLTSCQFAVKSGGHAASPGASSIQDGVTIDLKNLNQISLSSDQNIASIGPGNTWAPVYQTLEKQNVSMIGGRVGNVGAGGLILGGGVSYFSGIHGWACDNIANYEVVIANGSIINANVTSNPELYFALRGGGNNFGIVTRFDAFAFPQGPIFGATRAHSGNQTASLIKAFVNFAKASDDDHKGSLEMDFAAVNGTIGAAVDMRYADPIMKPALLDELLSIPAHAERVEIAYQSVFTILTEGSIPNGEQVLDFTATFALDEDMANELISIFVEETNSTWNLPGATPGIQLHPLTTNMLSIMEQNGGNPLGLNVADGNLFFIHLAALWSNPAHNDAMTTSMTNCYNRIIKTAGDKGLLNNYQYMNYANQIQDPIAAYGNENVDRLKDISKLYDPDGVFQTLAPGYFKLQKKD